MKKNVIFLICLILSMIAIGQNETQKMVDIDEVEVSPPKFTGIENVATYSNAENISLINNFLAKNTKYPQGAAEILLEGTEVVQFTVTPSGNVTNFNVINSVSKEIDKELIRVLKSTNGMWKPGYNNGKPTEMEQEVSLIFADYNESEVVKYFVKKAVYNYTEGSKHLFTEHKPKKAIKHYDMGIRYLPSDKGLLLLRGLCNYELGNIENAKSDWERIVTLGGMDIRDFYKEVADLSGYSEMNRILAQKAK